MSASGVPAATEDAAAAAGTVLETPNNRESRDGRGTTPRSYSFGSHGRLRPGWHYPQKGKYELHPSLIQEMTSQLENTRLPEKDYWDDTEVTTAVLWGFTNLLLLIIAVLALQLPLLNYLRGRPPIDLEFLLWSLDGAVTTLLLYAAMVLGSFSVFALHWLAANGWISVPLRELLYRFACGIHLLVPYKVFLNRSLSPVPAFFIGLQSLVLLLKNHSYYFGIRAKQIERHGMCPDLVSLKRFLYFLVIPSLVYRVEGYVHSPRIRMGFLLRRTLEALGCMFLIYELVVYSMMPVFKQVNQLSTVEFIVELMIPAVLLWTLLFIATFEVILNVFAEVTYFGDRRFYEDWWNSTNLAEFSRKWNRPVHDWLYLHVYRCLMRRGYTKLVAQLFVFLFSAIFHEMLLSITFLRVRAWMFTLMMLQIPLIYLAKLVPAEDAGHPVLRRGANLFFWFGMFFGPALLFLLYSKDYYQNT
ncbi:hypothetical protein CCYA_CCYA14G3828 [Cyanidiococcus yangmingshanensis]|nr:hypothetical protein CCYA_CCYA14G3828 [Cyanidiococcus yangmingshanensis]